MNLHFTSKLAATVFHNTASLDQNREFFQNWLFHKLTTSFCDREADFANGVNTPEGTMGTLHIGVDPREVSGTGTYNLTTYSFLWWISEEPIDKYGYPLPNAEPKLILNGGLHNHGTLDDPSWGSHT